MHTVLSRRLLGFTVLASLGAAAAGAQPNTSSAQWVEPGSVLSLRGSGYGTRPDHSPDDPSHLAAAWHSFDTALEGGGFYLDSRPYQWSRVPGGRTPSGATARKVRVDNDYGSLTHVQKGTTGTLFCTFWMKVPAQQQSGKFFRWYASKPTTDVYLSTGGGTYPSANLNLRGFSECGSNCVPNPTVQWSSPTKFQGGRWHRVEVVIKESPDEVSVYMDGALQWRKHSGDNQRWVLAPVNAEGHTLHIGADLDGPKTSYPAVGEYNFDDVYVDHTVARVELCEQSSWSACTKKEIQPLRSWSPSEVNVTFNMGALSPGSTAYAFVIDANGVVSNPVPVALPEGGNGPAPPRNLRTNP